MTREVITKAKRVTLSDTDEQIFDGIRNSDASSKSIKVRFVKDNADHIFDNVQTGEVIKCFINRVYSTGTDSTKVDGLFFS